MREGISEPVRLNDLAHYADLPTSHCFRMFRDETGLSPMAYCTHLRIRRACRMLDLTPKQIKTTAVDTGCSDPEYFSQACREVMGPSPEKYRAIK
jgi:transcriptional regulator GlxA family with amidase domain